MVLIVLVSLALGISVTIGLVAVLAILGRRTRNVAAGTLPGLDRCIRILQGVAGAIIIAIGIFTIARLYL